MEVNGVPIDDTFAEAFEGHYSRFLITAKNRRWAETAAKTATGYGSSIIGCSAETGVEGFLKNTETPDGRPGAVVQIWTGKKNMLHELLGRIGQCILTAPTTAVFDWCDSGEKIDVGNKMRFFADGYESYKRIDDREMVSIPVMMGEFLIEKELGIAKGILGGNFLIMGSSQDAALAAAEKAANAIQQITGVISSFPGGVCASGSKVGSKKYKFMKATTNELYCPSLRSRVAETKVPSDVEAIAEIVINGISEEAVSLAMKKGIEVATKIEEIKSISAANYGGTLGKVHIKLHSLWR
ncbi:MAG: formylmethanofuran--tetrahydromethanopterin N-formyltransferase [Candidatus Hydrothermarchaeales archaeon]